MKQKSFLLLLLLLVFLFIFSTFRADAAPLLASPLPEGRMLDEGHDTGYIDWNGWVHYENFYHRDALCPTGCWENVTRIHSGSSVSGSFSRDVTYFETMAAFEYGAGVVHLSACGATAQWYLGTSNPHSDPGFNSFPLNVPAGCRTWTISASHGDIHIRSVDVLYVAAPPTNTPTATATGTFTSTATSTNTATATGTATQTPTGTLTPSSTPTNTATASSTPTATQTFTPSPTVTASATFLPGTPSYTPRPPTNTPLPPPPPPRWDTATPRPFFSLPTATRTFPTATPNAQTPTQHADTYTIASTSLPPCLPSGEATDENANTDGNGGSSDPTGNLLASLGFATAGAALAALNARLKKQGSNKTASLAQNGIYVPVPRRETYTTTVGEWITRPVRRLVKVTRWVWRNITRLVPNIVTRVRNIVERIRRSKWVTTTRRVLKTFWERVTKRVPILGWLGRVIGWFWKTVVEPVRRWVTERVRRLYTWVETKVRQVVERVQDGWKTITERVRRRITEWVERTDWVQEWVTKEITRTRTVWERKFIPFGGGKIASPTRSRLLQLGAALGFTLSAASLLTLCAAPVDVSPTAVPTANATAIHETAIACAWIDATNTAVAATQAQATFTITPIPSTTPTPALVLSQQGLEMMAQFETFVPYLYNDPYNCTIGYGYLIHLGPCNGDPSETLFVNGISPEEGLKLLNQKVSEAEKAVKELIKVPLNQCQFDAMVSFTYNVGKGDKQLGTGLAGSALLEQLNQGNYEAVSGEMARFVKAYDEQGQLVEMSGLVNRRQVEGTLFTNCIYP